MVGPSPTPLMAVDSPPFPRSTPYQLPTHHTALLSMIATGRSASGRLLTSWTSPVGRCDQLLGNRDSRHVGRSCSAGRDWLGGADVEAKRWVFIAHQGCVG